MSVCFIYSLVNSQTLTKLAYNHPEGATLGLLAASMSIGSILAIPVVPYVADICGRRFGVVVGCVIMLFGVVMVSIGYKIALFVVGRIILGFGLGIAQVRATFNSSSHSTS